MHLLRKSRDQRQTEVGGPARAAAVANVIAIVALVVSGVTGYFAYFRPTLTAREGAAQIRNHLDRFEYDLVRIRLAVPDSIEKAIEAVGERGFVFAEGTQIALSELVPRLKPLADSLASEWQTVQLSTRFTIAAMDLEPDSFCCLPDLRRLYDQSESLSARKDSLLFKINKAMKPAG